MADAPLSPPSRGDQKLRVKEYRTIRYERDGEAGGILASEEFRAARDAISPSRAD